MLGARLRSSRRAAGFTLEALGERAGIDSSSLSRYERGRAIPYAAALRDIVLALPGVSADYLLGLDAGRPVVGRCGEPGCRLCAIAREAALEHLRREGRL